MTTKQLEHVRNRTAQINKDILNGYALPADLDQSEDARIGRHLAAGNKPTLKLKDPPKIAQCAARYCTDYSRDVSLSDVFEAPPVKANIDLENAKKKRGQIALKLEAKREQIVAQCVDEVFATSEGALVAYERETAQFRKLA